MPMMMMWAVQGFFLASMISTMMAFYRSTNNTQGEVLKRLPDMREAHPAHPYPLSEKKAS